MQSKQCSSPGIEALPNESVYQSRSKQCSSPGIEALPNEYLFKIFSLLSASSLARCCLVCTSWNQIITNSCLWKNVYLKCRKHWLQLSSGTVAARRISILNDEVHELVDWKSCYVQDQHNILFVLGSMLVKEWRGHFKRVECCRLKMETIVTGSSDGVVRTWSSISSKCLATYVIPNKGRVVDLEFDENKILAVSGTEIYIWNRNKGSLLRHIQGHNQFLHSMCYVDPEVLIGCADGTIRVFDIYSGQCARIFRQHSDRVTCIAVDILTSLLMSGSADGTVKLCDFWTGRKISCLLPSLPPTEVCCLNFLHQQSLLVGGTSRGDVHAWDIRKQKLLWSVRTGPNSIASLHSQFYDTTIIVTGSINGVINILDIHSGVILRSLVIAHDTEQMTTNEKSLDKLERHSAVIEHRGVDVDSPVEEIPSNVRPAILCLRTGMTKIVTTHPDGMIRVWHFKLQ